MNIEIKMRASPDRLSIQAPQAEMSVEIPNVVTYESSTRKIVAMGETQESLEKAPARWEQIKSSIKFVPIFDFQSFDPDFALAGILYYTFVAHTKVRPVARFFAKFFDKIDCNLWFPSYTSVPLETRTAFEFSVQEYVGLNTLSINGHVVGWPKWQRRAARWSFELLNLSLVLVAYFYGYFPLLRYLFKMLPAEFTGPVTTWQGTVLLVIDLGLTLAGVIALFYLVSFFSTVLWMVIMGRLLPKSLLKVMFPSLQKKYSLDILTPAANVLLREPDLDVH